MICTKFEAAKLRNELRRTGKSFSFVRSSLNSYGEPIAGPAIPVVTITALYHETSGSIEITMGDTTQVRTQKIPMLLCLYDGLYVGGKCLLKPNDWVEFNGKKYSVQGVTNVQEWNIIADISLKVIDDGNNA